ncbi:PREDICTED: uncharacterized protein LOC106121122 [Papilio xuthus]|uniref:Transcription factor 21 n=1 Tax=Papilio xuthus TaxID=66420 RepID=A0A194PEF5_PAPXU|nr:PREDICTED: uncharacterized protein LOC106121122 [Papilio xuthus]KPI91736.1 Transcription factor 21 [Papilio xuthus]
MPRKRVNRSPHVDKRSDDQDDDDFLFDDTQSSSGRSSHEPQHRNAANARERARMRVLSKAFCRLKTTLPWVPADTKLSKLDTLRLAASYIAHLRALLAPRSAHAPPHPLSLAWPFAFQHGGTLSCAISQRWNLNTQSSDGASDNHRNNLQIQENLNNVNCNDTYNQEYSENDYDERGYEERGYDEVNEPSAVMQYCDYGYKESYYEMRNSHNCDALMNNA